MGRKRIYQTKEEVLANRRKMVLDYSIEFLNYMSIPNTPLHRQVKIHNKRVDGYDPITTTIFEFLGDYWHGNPKKYNPLSLNQIIKVSFSKLYNETIDRFTFLHERGYAIKYIWESDWETWNSCNRVENIPLENFHPI
jgi:hypothetical protein